MLSVSLGKQFSVEDDKWPTLPHQGCKYLEPSQVYERTRLTCQFFQHIILVSRIPELSTQRGIGDGFGEIPQRLPGGHIIQRVRMSPQVGFSFEVASPRQISRVAGSTIARPRLPENVLLLRRTTEGILSSDQSNMETDQSNGFDEAKNWAQKRSLHTVSAFQLWSHLALRNGHTSETVIPSDSTAKRDLKGENIRNTKRM